MQYAVGLLVAALTFDKTKVSASCARIGMYIHSTIEKGFRDWTPRIDFSNNGLTDALTYRRYANRKARKRLYLLCSSRQKRL